MQVYPPSTEIGQYRVLSDPMLGGMGVVYICHDLKNDRPVALKTLKPEYLPYRAARDRFLHEGTAWVELGKHPQSNRQAPGYCLPSRLSNGSLFDQPNLDP